MERNHEIVEDWLKMKFPYSEIEELSIGKIAHAITISMGKWFNGIEMKPFRFKGVPVDVSIEDSYDEELSSPHGDYNSCMVWLKVLH